MWHIQFFSSKILKINWLQGSKKSVMFGVYKNNLPTGFWKSYWMSADLRLQLKAYTRNIATMFQASTNNFNPSTLCILNIKLNFHYPKKVMGRAAHPTPFFLTIKDYYVVKISVCLIKIWNKLKNTLRS